MRRIAFMLALVLVPGLGAVACSGSDSDTSSSSAPDAGHSEPTTQTIGAAGGTVSSGGVTLTIPAGALAADTPIAITQGGATIPPEYTALSPMFTFSPDGTHFLVPVTVTFTMTSQGSAPTIEWSNASGGYDPLPTTVSGAIASASIDHFSHGFVGERRGPPDAGAADSSAGTDASGGDAAVDAASDAAVSDASDAGAPESGASDAASSDAAIDAAIDASTDAASDAATDAATSAPGIVVTVDGTQVTFAANQKVTLGNGTTTIQADDNATTTHWTLQITMTGAPQEACQANGAPTMTYTHYANGASDALYSTQVSPGACTLLVTSVPASPGQHAKGSILSATLERVNAPVNSPVSHSFTNGTFDLID